MGLFQKTGLGIFLLLIGIHCLFIYLDMPAWRMYSKLLLVPVLMAWIWSTAGKQVPLIVYAGLFFSFIGDLLLTREGDLFFLIGMVAFMLTHFCNSLYFLRLQDTHSSRLREALVAAVLLILLSIIIFSVLNPYLGSFRVPVLVYMLAISIMAILAANTAANPPLRSIALRCFIPGAALFVVSDTLLAMNKFIYHQQTISILVMLTYGIGQLLLVRGFAGTTAFVSRHKN